MVPVRILAALLVLYGLHRLARWAERRGWIYYLERRGTSGALGNAFLEIQSIMEPGKRYVVEERARPGVKEQDSGDPPSAPRG
jgi:hypothetical protein